MWGVYSEQTILQSPIEMIEPHSYRNLPGGSVNLHCRLMYRRGPYVLLTPAHLDKHLPLASLWLLIASVLNDTCRVPAKRISP